MIGAKREIKADGTEARIPTPPTWDWRDDAACVDTMAAGDDDEWAALRTSSCPDCPVRRHCLEYGLAMYDETGVIVGVWGGLSFGLPKDLRRRDETMAASVEAARNYLRGAA